MKDRAFFGNSGYARIANDAYFTVDPRPVRGLVKWLRGEGCEVEIKGEVWEPFAGAGHISKQLNAAGYKVISTELHDYGFGQTGQDFFKYALPLAKTIITNPPYEKETLMAVANKIAAWVRAGELDYGFLLLRDEWGSAKARKHLLQPDVFLAKLSLSFRPRWFSPTDLKATEPEKSPRHNFAWYVWGRSLTGPRSRATWQVLYE